MVLGTQRIYAVCEEFFSLFFPQSSQTFTIIIMIIDAKFIESPEQQFGRTIGTEVPIFLNTLGCEESDTMIISCSRHDLLGLTGCIHAQDVYVHCEGKQQL